jgi:hypothetical protein
MSVKSFYSDLPPVGKVLVVGAGLFAAWKVYGLIVGHIDKKEDRQNVASYKTELERLAAMGIYPSYSAAQYTSWANEIEESFSGCDPINLSSFTLIAILKKLKNDADFASLVTAWGVRSYPDCLWGTVSGDLFTAVNSELNFLDRGSCNNVLAARGITYRF